jgi:hypothetical protein
MLQWPSDELLSEGNTRIRRAECTEQRERGEAL